MGTTKQQNEYTHISLHWDSLKVTEPGYISILV